MKLSPISFDKLIGTKYEFPFVGDVLPMHIHSNFDNHISIINKGSFKAHGDNWELTLVAGNIVDWPPHKQHEFIALEPNSVLISIRKS
jgi:quercetin dioxygenase-like cupin family protein